MEELCLVPESFLCLELETFRDPGTDTDLERCGSGVAEDVPQGFLLRFLVHQASSHSPPTLELE